MGGREVSCSSRPTVRGPVLPAPTPERNESKQNPEQVLELYPGWPVNGTGLPSALPPQPGVGAAPPKGAGGAEGRGKSNGTFSLRVTILTSTAQGTLMAQGRLNEAFGETGKLFPRLNEMCLKK